MGGVAELTAEVAALRERLGLLSEACLRINESLDVETVLQGVLDGARSLAGTRYGIILLYGSDGWIVDSVSSGASAEQARQFWEMPNGMALHRHFDEFEGTVRLRDFHSYIEEHGLPEFDPPFPVNSVVPILAVSVRYRGERVGAVYLADKNEESAVGGGGLEFTLGDEEAMAVFASQAALVISRARIHREEQRARAYFETLLNTTPVGVLVFDAETSALMCANREATRIVGDLLIPGGSAEELLDTATYRSSDDGEIPLNALPVAKVLRSGEVVRAEEVVIEAPDGSRITAMVNATPILSDEGAVESVVVSVQDTSPMAELERLRAEFLGMVGHELRTPLASIKGSTSTLLESGTSLDPAETLQYHRIINEQADYMRDLIGDLIDVVRIETGSLSIHPEPTELARLVDNSRNTFLAAGGRAGVRINPMPDLPLVMADRRRIAQVINNLLVNAARNSHETSAIRVDAAVEGVHVAVSVADSGRGVPAERLPHLFQKFSRPEDRDKNRDLGLGLAICKGIVEAHGGRIRAESDGPGLGSRFTFTVPTSAQAPAAPAARIHTAAPAARIHTAAPAARIHTAAPAARIHTAAPAARIHTAAPAARIHTAAPAARIHTAAPAARIHTAAPAAAAARIHTAAPAARIHTAAPAARIHTAAPAARIHTAAPAAAAARIHAAAPAAAAARIHAAAPVRRVGSEQIRVLAVDDDPRLLKHVRDSLANAGYSPIVTGDPQEVPSLIEEAQPHVVLLDLMLPGADGVELMRDIHASNDTPVIFLSAYDQDELIAKAFDNGAVDYIVKPFSPTELAARVNAALRKKAEHPSSFELRQLVINYAERSVAVAGRHVEMTPIEYRLLVELSTNIGSALTHEQLLLRVWGPSQSGDARPLRTAIKNLRRKLGDTISNPKYILTVPRVGYRMPKPDAPA